MICSACAGGDHDHHTHVVQAVPEGIIGGSTCRCEGECSDGRYRPAEPMWVKKVLEALR